MNTTTPDFFLETDFGNSPVYLHLAKLRRTEFEMDFSKYIPPKYVNRARIKQFFNKYFAFFIKIKKNISLYFKNKAIARQENFKAKFINDVLKITTHEHLLATPRRLRTKIQDPEIARGLIQYAQTQNGM